MSPAQTRFSRAAFGAALALALLHAAPSMARTVERSIDRNISDGTSNAVPAASATIDCGGKKITIGSGGSGGSCTTNNTGPGGTPFAVCRKEGGGAVATASCAQGCTAVGVGTCSTTQ